MQPTGSLADADWESHRPAVFGAAYRILGTVAEAEDVTQEVWLRAAGAEVEEVDLLADLRAGWPTGEDMVHSHCLVEALARLRREVYRAWVDTHPPTPLMTEEELREVHADRSTMRSTARKPYRAPNSGVG